MAAVAVGARQQQVPHRAQRVDLQFAVEMVVAVGVDEDLEAVAERLDLAIAQRNVATWLPTSD